MKRSNKPASKPRRKPLLLESYEDRILCDAAPVVDPKTLPEAEVAVVAEHSTAAPAPAPESSKSVYRKSAD